MVCSRAAVVGLVMLAGFAATKPADATTYNFNYTQGLAGMPAAVNSGGYIDTVSTQFDSSTDRLSFSVAFGPATGQSKLTTQGFWLAMDNGPAPVGMANQLSVFYFDASTLSSPKLVSYAYDGSGTELSYTHGDLIKGAWETSYINSISAQDQTTASGLRRVMSFDIDATSIISHSPLTKNGTWYGTGFGSTIGMWLYTAGGYSATYSAPRGGIGTIAYNSPGWLSFGQVAVPAPGAGAILGIGGLAAMRRRRRA